MNIEYEVNKTFRQGALEHRVIKLFVLNCSDPEDEEIFKRNLFSFFEYKDRQFLSCDTLFQRLKKRILGYERSLILLEIPNVIKLNTQSYFKFERIKRIFEIANKL